MELKNISAIETKSYNTQIFSSSNAYTNSVSMSPAIAFWMYRISDTIADACDRISWAFEQLTPVLKDKKTNDYIKEHPLLELLNSPGDNITGDQLQFEIMTNYLVTGEFYPVLEGNVDYEPFGIYVVPTDNTNIMRGQDGWLGTIFTSAEYDTNEYNKVISKRNIALFQIRSKLKETTQILNKTRSNDIRAQSLIERIYFQAITKYYGAIHNSSILKNGSRPSGIWSPANDGISQNEYDAFKKSIKSSFEGPENAGRNIITSQPIKYQNLVLNPKDMDFVNLIETSKNEIYNQYHIPLPLVTTSTMTMNNYENAIVAFYDLAVLPRAKFVYKQLGNFMLGRYKDGERFELVINEKELPALKERLFNRAKKMREVYAFSEDEIRTETGYETIGDEGRQIYKPATLVPAGDDDYIDDIIKR